MDNAMQLLLGSILAGIIGIERECRGREAGFRTHLLVGLGSTLITLISQFGFGVGSFHDTSRIAAQIVSGVGFLCAGTIFLNKNAVKGLTTAAGLWVAAGIGMAIGCEMYSLGIIGTAIVLVCMETSHICTKDTCIKIITVTLKDYDNSKFINIIYPLKQSLKDFKLISSSLEKCKSYDILTFTFKIRVYEEEIDRVLDTIKSQILTIDKILIE